MGAATIEYTKHGVRTTSFIHGVSSLADSVALALALTAYTNAGISRVGFTVAQDSTISPEVESGDFQTMSFFALVFFRDENNAIVKLVLPAPKKSQYSIVGKNLKLNKTHGDALATILGEKIGKTLKFLHGGVTSAS